MVVELGASGPTRANLPGMADSPTNGPVISVGEMKGFAHSKNMPLSSAPIASTSRRPPPDNYTCNRCGTKGHWLEDCPTRDSKGGNKVTQNGPPPPGYICKRCDVPGHFISACPKLSIPPDNYTCHRCKLKGHWKQDCPQTDSGGSGGGGGGNNNYGGNTNTHGGGGGNTNNYGGGGGNNYGGGGGNNHGGGQPHIDDKYGGQPSHAPPQGSLLGDRPPPQVGLLSPPRTSKRPRESDSSRDAFGRERR